ncbi:helix-turn-helix transcriptional regulator [Labrenzia aggregata]|uniref:Helix-turn-helix transcriptional regulator n=2 Tax=Roseibium aggregatum TaxID=187304 RepID=A0A939E913_9HYPH|nr:helix-turn-helix transcriptional regulator [Roseibium aggregatum]
MDINTLVKLTSRAWSLKALALLHEGVPARQAPLLAASGASRTAFVQSLRHLEELGLMERNPGHGHPLRPEFRLTPKGQALAPIAHRIEATVRDDAGAALLRKMWTVPLLAVASRPKLFSEIKRDLVPITDRALSKSLRELDERNWIERSVDAALRPPRPYYRVINEGAGISRAIGLQGQGA